MALDPFVFLANRAVFVIEPAMEARGSEARRVAREISLYGFQRQTGFRDQVAENWREGRIFQIVENRIEVRRLADKALGLRVTKIAHEPPRRYRAVDLVAGGEDRIRNRKARAPVALPLGFGHAAAPVAKQF